MNSRFTIVIVVLFFIAGMGISQTGTKGNLSKKPLSLERSDFGNNNQPAGDPVTEPATPASDTEKTLAKPGKSTYILSNQTPNRSTSSVTTYDFTESADMYYGGASGAKDLGDGKWGMIAGDANGNGQIQIDDKNDYWWVQAGMSGYRTGDFNLNGQVQIDDKNDYWWINAGIGSQVP